jgi:hypothetical protein
MRLDASSQEHDQRVPIPVRTVRPPLPPMSAHELVGEDIESREHARSKCGGDRNVGGIAPARHQDAADTRRVVAGVEGVPVIVEVDLEPSRETLRQRHSVTARAHSPDRRRASPRRPPRRYAWPARARSQIGCAHARSRRRPAPAPSPPGLGRRGTMPCRRAGQCRSSGCPADRSASRPGAPQPGAARQPGPANQSCPDLPQ